jgi:hypothetical protein
MYRALALSAIAAIIGGNDPARAAEDCAVVQIGDIFEAQCMRDGEQIAMDAGHREAVHLTAALRTVGCYEAPLTRDTLLSVPSQAAVCARRLFRERNSGGYRFGRERIPNGIVDRLVALSRSGITDPEEAFVVLGVDPADRDRRVPAAPVRAPFADLDPAEGRVGVVYTSENDQRIEFGCATGEFGALTGRPYVMFSAPMAMLGEGGDTLRFVDPATAGYWARLSITNTSGRGRGSPPLPIAVSGIIPGETGDRIAVAIDASSRDLQRTLRTIVAESAAFESFYAGLFPPNGNAVMSVHVEGVAGTDPRLAEGIDLLLRGCQ